MDDLFAEGANHTDRRAAGHHRRHLLLTTTFEAAGLVASAFPTTGTDAVLALTTGKIDCVIIDNEPAKAFVAANEGLKILDTEYAVEDYAIAAWPRADELTAKFNEALAELTADGTIHDDHRQVHSRPE